MGKKDTTAAPLRLHRYIMGGLLLLIIGIGTWLSLEARHHEDKNIRGELLRQASSVASGLSMENMRDLSFRAEDIERPAYQRITRQLRAYALSTGMHRLYTLGLRDGQLFFGPESLLPDDPNAAPPGTLHQKPPQADFEAFRTAEAATYGPYSDEFGEFVSAIVPVFDSLSGKVLLVVGLDMEASVWRKKLNRAQHIPVMSTLSILSLLLLGYIVHGVYKRSPNMRVEYLRNIAISIYFAIMLLLSVIAFICVREAEHRTEQELFRAEASAKSQYFAEATEQIDLVLHLLIGFFEASENIDREEFGAFCRHIFEGYPVESCYWIPAWSANDAPSFTARVKAEGFPDFSIRRFSKDDRGGQDSADPIYPVVYAEPSSRLSVTLGYDFYSHPVLRETLEETLRSGSDHACMVSAPTPNSTEPAGYFVFVPISHPRQGGLVCFSVNLEALIKGSDPSSEIPAIASALFELQPDKKPQPLSCSSCDHCDDMLEADLYAKSPLFAFGNTYMMLFTAEPTWFASNPQRAAWWMLGIGLTLALLLTYTAAVLINRPLLLAKQVIKRTHELAESKERFDIAISAAKMGVWEHYLESDRYLCNDRMLEIYGIQTDEFDGNRLKWANFVHPEDHNHFIRELTAAKRGEKDLDIEVRIIRSTGEIRHIRAYGKTIYGEDQSPARMIGVNLDITERKRQEDALQASEEMMRNSQSVAHICSYSTLLDGNEIEESQWVCSPEFYKIFGIDETYPHTIAGWAGFIHPNFRDEIVAYHEAVVKERKAFNKEYKIIRIDDGAERWVHGTGKLEFDEKGTPIRMHGAIQDITERKQSQQALEESRQLLCNIIDTMPERVWWKDLDSRYLGCNIHVAHDAGLDHPDQLIGKTDFDLCWAVHAETFIANDREIIESGIPRLFDPELQILEDGSTRWIEVSTVPLKDTNGMIFGVLGCYSDISDRKRAEKKLIESEDRLRRAQQVAQVGNWEFNMETGVVSASEEAKRIYGLEDRQWTISEIQKIPLEKDRDRLDRELKALIEHGKPYDIEFTIKRPTDGALREIHSVAEYDPAKKLVFGVIQDITDRKLAERSLALSEAKYRDLFEQSADACLIIKDGRFVDCNQAAAEMLHCESREQVINKPPAELSPERQPDGALSLTKADEIVQRMEKEKTLRFEWVHKRADGEIFPVEVSLTSITDSEGSQIIYTTWRDLTDRKQAEEKLIRLSTAIEQSPESIVITDTDGVILYVNPAFERNTGYSADEALGENPRILKSGEHSPSNYAEMWEAISNGKIWEGRIINKRKNGSLFTEEVSISPVRNDEGEIVNYVAVKRDMTHELVKEEELRQAQKMEAVGQLAGGVAHDFNNILQGIIGFSELLRYSLDETSLEYNNANEIHKSANRAAKLTQQLLTFSRKQAVQLTDTALNDIVYDTEALLNVLLGDQHQLVLDLEDELPLVYADSGQLTQIIMNLAVNARDAMPEGGRLSISTESILIGEADAAFIAGASPGHHLCLAVTDTGSGMDDETKSRIFIPFFTTKEIGFGTGLGLAVIYGIVEQNKGWINVYSEIGKGSCFKVYLPVAESHGKEAEEDPKAGQQGRNSRILLVEDEQKILEMTRKVLEGANFNVTAAASAEEGLTLFDEDPDGFDLLMSDMVLPGIQGDELAAALRIKNPELPVLLLSGYRDQATRWRHFTEKGYLFINKPFTITNLLDTVRNLLKDNKGTDG